MNSRRLVILTITVALVLAFAAGIIIGESAGADPRFDVGTSVQGEELAAAEASGDAAAIEWVSARIAAFIAALSARQQEAARAASLWARWGPVNRCEQGGEWHAYGRFGNGLMGGGGLGISDGAWQENGGTAYASTAAGASPEQQMIVAERIFERYGPGAWGCPVR